ncbi:MAG: type II secretion system protein [Verrucomicrobiota bacterium]
MKSQNAECRMQKIPSALLHGDPAVAATGDGRPAPVLHSAFSILAWTRRGSTESRPTAGFTLFELLVVIAVIGVLMGLLFPVSGIVKKNQVLAATRAELKQVQTAIEAYKAKLGFYPPDHSQPGVVGRIVTNQLFFELKGTVFNPATHIYTTLDGTASIPESDALNLFGAGFINTSTSAAGTDEKPGPVNFLPHLRPKQVGILVNSSGTEYARLLVCSMEWPDGMNPPVWNPSPPPSRPQPPPILNPWNYVSSSPTNNPNSYDLWVDVKVKDTVYRVSNWNNK